MKRTLLPNVERLRYMAMLLVFVLSAGYAKAALESDDINNTILVPGSIPVKWTNDAEHPWFISDDGTYIRTEDGNTDFVTTLTAEYTSDYPTKLTFDYQGYTHSSYPTITIDDKDSSLSGYYAWHSYLDFIPAGTHKITFTLSSKEYSGSSEYHFDLKNFRVWECKELETQVLAPTSKPLTFENDPQSPWIAEEGYIYSTKESYPSLSTISTTFTIEKPSIFSYESNNPNDSYNMSTDMYINGILFEKDEAHAKWTYNSVVLYPGTYTIEFVNNVRSSNRISQLRNIRLDDPWYNVTVSQPGTFSTKLLQALGDKNLQDAELVKISGSINENDWTAIKQLINIKAIDFTDCDITAIPDGAFRDLAHLSTVMLPETLKEIGHDAFRGTNSHQITIPSSVESIGYRAWYGTPLQYITFADNSNLWRIGAYTFAETKLIEFDMPDSVTTVGRIYYYSNTPNWDIEWKDGSNDTNAMFYGCEYLKRLHLSDGLPTVPRQIAYECSALEDVNVPKNATEIEWQAFYRTNIKSIDLPESLHKIGYGAFSYSALESIVIPKNVIVFGSERTSDGNYIFSYCKNLKEVTLNSHPWNMYYDFRDCTALETVILPCPTPPSITYDPFYNVDKVNLKLIVPDFAEAAYRADPYWYQFVSLRAGDEASQSDSWAIRGKLTLDDSHKMHGIPDIELMNGGVLNMDGEVAQNFNSFTYNTSESSPASYLSESNSVNADVLVMNFEVEKANQWYFFSPVCDVKMSDISYPETDSWVIRYYDGARRAANNDNSGNWVNVPADGTLLRGQGYIIQANKSGVLHMPVAATEHEKFFGSNEVVFELDDNACETAANAGWNFVANPYPSYYDIYYLDMQAPITVWTGSTYRAYSLNDGDRGDDTFVLRPMQPFFVQKATADLTTGLPLTGRRTSTVIDRTRAPRRIPGFTDSDRQLLNLELLCGENNEADDYTRIVLNEGASIKYEMSCDASKFMSLNDKVAQIYSLGNDKEALAINERPYENGIVALGLYLPTQGDTYRIAATRVDRQAWLYDAETGMEHDLSLGDYIFTSIKKGFDNDRFSIRFISPVSGVENVVEGTVKVTANVGALTIVAPQGAEIAVYATDGTTVAKATSEGSALDITVAAGIYVVKVNGETFKTIVK